MKEKRKCSIEGCERKYIAKEFCNMHRKRFRRGETNMSLKKLHRKRGICKIEGCNKPHKARGYCGLHYNRFKHGIKDMSPNLIRKKGLICLFEGCNMPNRRWGYCAKHFWANIRKEMITVYGGKCSCCGETEPMFLELDHIHNDGKIRRKMAGNSQQEIKKLKRQGWPKNNHRLLCCNCNHGRMRNKGICPHQKRMEIQ